MKKGDIIRNEYDGCLSTIQDIQGDKVTLFYHDLESLKMEFGEYAYEIHQKTEVIDREQLEFAWSKGYFVAI